MICGRAGIRRFMFCFCSAGGLGESPILAPYLGNPFGEEFSERNGGLAALTVPEGEFGFPCGPGRRLPPSPSLLPGGYVR